MDKERENQVREMVRAEILYVIKNDLYQKGEQIMKHVWEDLETDEEYSIADNEMLRIIEVINNLPLETDK